MAATIGVGVLASAAVGALGTVTVRVFDVAKTTLAPIPLKVTVFLEGSGSKPSPRITTRLPATP